MPIRNILIYISGPYRASCIWGIRENIRRAELAQGALMEAGFAVHNPHKNTALMDGACGLTDNDWLENDFVILKRCDAMLLLEGWKASEGACQERSLARVQEIPIFCTIEKLVEHFRREREEQPEHLGAP